MRQTADQWAAGGATGGPLVSSHAAAKLSGSREQNDALHIFFYTLHSL